MTDSRWHHIYICSSIAVTMTISSADGGAFSSRGSSISEAGTTVASATSNSRPLTFFSSCLAFLLYLDCAHLLSLTSKAYTDYTLVSRLSLVIFIQIILASFRHLDILLWYKIMAVQAETLSVPSTYAGHLTNGDPTKAAAVYKPTHPDLFEVQFRDGEYNSCLVALKVRLMSRKSLQQDILM